MFYINRQWRTEREAWEYLRSYKWESASIAAVLSAMVGMGSAYYQPVEL